MEGQPMKPPNDKEAGRQPKTTRNRPSRIARQRPIELTWRTLGGKNKIHVRNVEEVGSDDVVLVEQMMLADVEGVNACKELIEKSTGVVILMKSTNFHLPHPPNLLGGADISGTTHVDVCGIGKGVYIYSKKNGPELMAAMGGKNSIERFCLAIMEIGKQPTMLKK